MTFEKTLSSELITEYRGDDILLFHQSQLYLFYSNKPSFHEQTHFLDLFAELLMMEKNLIKTLGSFVISYLQRCFQIQG